MLHLAEEKPVELRLALLCLHPHARASLIQKVDDNDDHCLLMTVTALRFLNEANVLYFKQSVKCEIRVICECGVSLLIALLNTSETVSPALQCQESERRSHKPTSWAF